MDGDSWAARLSSPSERNLFNSQSRSVGIKWDGFGAEMLMGFEEIDMDDDIREKYGCPFCSEYFDILGLCCHIDDEHPVGAKNGICPVCARLDVDMVGHITLHHANIFKAQQRKRKSLKVGLHSKLSLLRELKEGKLHSLFGGSSQAVSSSNAAPDPLLSSFISPIVADFRSVPSHSSTELGSVNGSATTNISTRNTQVTQPPPLSIEDQEEKAKRCEFVQGLLLSTILDENL